MSSKMKLGQLIKSLALLFYLLQAALVAPAQPSSQPAVGALRIRAWPSVEGRTRRLDRKRFFLVRGSLAANRAWVEKTEQTPLLARDCYYRGVGASEALIRWLTKGDCDNVYCREVTAEDLEGAGAVPEFQAAYQRGRREFGSADVARKWLTVSLPGEIRNGFYRRQQELLRALLREAETVSHAPVQTAMTDRNGSAYFTDLEPGTYVVSNLLPTEVGGVAILWNCEVEIKPKELSAAMKRPMQLNNAPNAPQKCFVEKALPACPAHGA